ncbi:type I restriction-modification system methyltransferase subunit [Lacticaseibacillus paracasei subsp. paracasei CNCM I-2877]|nr:type I restriction-modification system methyltransferase subunit [Lacticaseibacillus paracasei subsp. paracasei CNCM I-2877]
MAQMTSQTLYQALWNSADILRSKMDASEYKNYLLG